MLRKKTYISFLVSLLLLIGLDISSYDNLVYGSDDGDGNDKREKAKHDDDGDGNDKREKAKHDDDGDGNDKREKAKHDDDGDGNDKRETSLEELFENDDENEDDENEDDENDIPFILPFNAVPFP